VVRKKGSKILQCGDGGAWQACLQMETARHSEEKGKEGDGLPEGGVTPKSFATMSDIEGHLIGGERKVQAGRGFLWQGGGVVRRGVGGGGVARLSFLVIKGARPARKKDVCKKEKKKKISLN